MIATRALRGLLSQTVRTSLNVNRNNAFKQVVGSATRHFATAPPPKATPPPSKATPPPTKAEPTKTTTPPPAASQASAAAEEEEEYTGYKTPTKYTTDPTQIINVSGRAGQYAAALYEAIGTKVDDVEQEFTFMEELFEEEPGILDEMNSDIRSEADRLQFVKNLAAATPMSDCTVSFFNFLATSNILYSIPEIISEYHAIIKTNRKIRDVRVYVAHPADAVEFQNYSDDKKDEFYTQLGFPEDTQEVNVSYFYDPSLVQGMIIRTDTEEIDMSMATQIKKVDEALEGQYDRTFKNTVKQFREVEEDESAPEFDFSLSPEARKEWIDKYFATQAK